MAIALTAVAIVLVVAIHYETLRLVWRLVHRMSRSLRLRMGLALLGALAGHILENSVFAVAYYIIIEVLGSGQLVGTDGVPAYEISDYSYFSFVVYTSLGFGDLVPKGDVRLLASGEVLAGLVLIAWTASFLFLLMQRYWERK